MDVKHLTHKSTSVDRWGSSPVLNHRSQVPRLTIRACFLGFDSTSVPSSGLGFVVESLVLLDGAMSNSSSSSDESSITALFLGFDSISLPSSEFGFVVESLVFLDGACQVLRRTNRPGQTFLEPWIFFDGESSPVLSCFLLEDASSSSSLSLSDRMISFFFFFGSNNAVSETLSASSNSISSSLLSSSFQTTRCGAR